MVRFCPSSGGDTGYVNSELDRVQQHTWIVTHSWNSGMRHLLLHPYCFQEAAVMSTSRTVRGDPDSFNYNCSRDDRTNLNKGKK